MLYFDNRIGNAPRLILAQEEPKLMMVPDELRKCVAFVGRRLPAGDVRLLGTAFFLSKPSQVPEVNIAYIVTAKHILDGIRDKGGASVCVRLNLKGHDARWADTDIGAWSFHPDAPEEVDAAVIISALSEQCDHLTYPIRAIATEEIIKEKRIGLGNEVFLAGLFHEHYGARRNIPIVRAGNIAAMPEEKVTTRWGSMDAYLIEARSIGGLSGSPVFVHLGAIYNRDGMVHVTNRSHGESYLLGLMHGHWDIQTASEDIVVEDRVGDSVNMGIGIVVPATKILEIIEGPEMKAKEKKATEAFRKQKRLPVMDTLDEPAQDEEFTRDRYEEILGRVSRMSFSHAVHPLLMNGFG